MFNYLLWHVSSNFLIAVWFRFFSISNLRLQFFFFLAAFQFCCAFRLFPLFCGDFPLNEEIFICTRAQWGRSTLCFFLFCEVAHTLTLTNRERETRDESDSWMLQQADARHETNWAVLKNCFCLLAANCATLCEEHERRERMSSAAGEHRVTTETELTYEHRAQPAQASPTVDSRRESEIQKNVNVNLPAGIRTARESTARCYSAQRSLLLVCVGCGLWAVMGCARWLTVDLWAVCVRCWAYRGAINALSLAELT